MKVSELLTWLHMAALDQMSEHDIRDVLEQVLEATPDEGCENVELLLDAIEDQLDAETVDPKALLAWPRQFASLLPAQPAPAAKVEEQPPSEAADRPEEEIQSPRLARFAACLTLIDVEDPTSQAHDELKSLEQEIALAWDEYSTEPFDPEAVSAQSAAGHRFLRDGFVCWFEAFNLARAGQPQQALTAAREGNRLFRAVALWSDDVGTS